MFVLREKNNLPGVLTKTKDLALKKLAMLI